MRDIEATLCDYKLSLETEKPKSWIKSVSAFANGVGGSIRFGYSKDPMHLLYTYFRKMQ